MQRFQKALNRLLFFDFMAQRQKFCHRVILVNPD
jgi:hypothetical protein